MTALLGTSVVDAGIAWVGLPVLAAITCLGMGLLAERAARVPVPTPLLFPLGACLSIIALLPGYRLHLGGWFGALVLVAGTVAGLVLGRSGLRARLRPGPAAVAALAVLGLYLAPVVLSGSWTWGGYNFLNDTAVQFVLTDQLQHVGAQLVQGPPSTRSEVIRSYLGSQYPLGSHAHLATLTTLLRTTPDVVYQGYLAALAAGTALALTVLARRAGLGRWAAAAAGAVGAASNLYYQYALQGSIKEVAAVMCLVTAGALAWELLRSERPVASAALLAVAFAAMIDVFSVAAGPYVVLIAVLVVAAAFLWRGAGPLRHRLVPAAAVAVALTTVAALPVLLDSLTFLQVAQSALGPQSTTTSTLGQLSRPLEAIEIAGVWLNGSYSQAIGSPLRDIVTHALCWGILALLVVTLVVQLRARRPVLAVLALGALIATAVVAPRASAYADAKLLAVASPVVLFTAMCGALSLGKRFRSVGTVAACVVALGVVVSDAYAYHVVRLAPVDRMAALQDAADRTRGRGLVLLNEVEEFGKFYGRHTQLNVGFEALTPKQARPFGGGYHLDLDQLEIGWWRQFATIILRRAPDASRPSADYALAYANRYYEVWERRPGVQIFDHLSLQAVNQRGAVPQCANVRAVARRAPAGTSLVAAPVPDTVSLDPVSARDRPNGWPPLPAPPGVVSAITPGLVEAQRTFAGGDYAVWVRGSGGRAVSVRVDGRTVSRVQGIDTQGQWQWGGTVQIPAGSHRVSLERPGGSLRPGDGAPAVLGPVDFVSQRSPSGLHWVPLARWRSLCTGQWDWIEAARH